MPALLILGPLFGLAALFLATHAQKAPLALAGSGSLSSPSSRQIELDHGMPEGLVHEVLTALVHVQDAAQLVTLANKLGSRYPLAAGELRAKAAALSPADKDAPARPGPDTSDAAVILQAAMRALTEENDPVSLEGFAESIRTKYPTATVLLLGRARDLRASAASAAPAATTTPPAAPQAVPSVLSPPPAPAVMAPATVAPVTYYVQPGDTPSRIAEKLGRHDRASWRELVAANPAKATTPDGNFVALRAGETLSLPASWAAPTPSTHPTEARS